MTPPSPAAAGTLGVRSRREQLRTGRGEQGLGSPSSPEREEQGLGSPPVQGEKSRGWGPPPVQGEESRGWGPPPVQAKSLPLILWTKRAAEAGRLVELKMGLEWKDQRQPGKAPWRRS
jgi:hypothetical protein